MKVIRYLIVILLVALVYGNTLTLHYTLDDRMIIFENDYTLKGWSGVKDVMTKDAFTGFFGDDDRLVAGGRYRPLSQITFIAEYELFGGDLKEQSGFHRDPKNEELFSNSKLPIFQHLGNVVLFMLLCITVLAVLQKLFPQFENEKWWLSLPFVATLLFALHPLHTEAVANIKGRDEIMCMLGAMLTLLVSLKYVDSKKWYWLLLAFLTMLFAVFSKENAITFLAVVPLALYFYDKPKKWSDYLVALIPLVLASAVFLVARHLALGGFLNATDSQIALNNPFVNSTKGQEIATVIYTWGIYLILMIFPHPLTHDYYPNEIPITDFSNLLVLLMLLFVLAMVVFALWKLPKKNVLSFGILFFVITFSITSNLLFNVGTFMNERFVFTSLLGFNIILAYLIQKLARLPKSKSALISIFTIVLLAYGGKTFARNFAWKDDIKLFITDVQTSSESQKCNLSAGGSYLTLYEKEHKAKYLTLAEKHLLKAVKLGRHDTDTYSLLGKLYFIKKEYDQAEWYYRAILADNPGDKQAADNLKLTEMVAGSAEMEKINELIDAGRVDEALSKVNESIAQSGETEERLNALGRIYGEKRGDLDKSIQFLERALELNPDFASAQENLGIAFAMKGRVDEAIRHLNRAHELDPTNQRILKNLAMAYHQKGDFANESKVRQLLQE